MSKNSAFSSFADAAQQELTNTEYFGANGVLTVQELIDILQTIVSKNPSAKDAPAAFAEGGSIIPAYSVAIHNGEILICE